MRDTLHARSHLWQLSFSVTLDEALTLSNNKVLLLLLLLPPPPPPPLLLLLTRHHVSVSP